MSQFSMSDNVVSRASLKLSQGLSILYGILYGEQLYVDVASWFVNRVLPLASTYLAIALEKSHRTKPAKLTRISAIPVNILDNVFGVRASAASTSVQALFFSSATGTCSRINRPKLEPRDINITQIETGTFWWLQKQFVCTYILYIISILLVLIHIL